jgi:hypothetical protein
MVLSFVSPTNAQTHSRTNLAASAHMLLSRAVRLFIILAVGCSSSGAASDAGMDASSNDVAMLSDADGTGESRAPDAGGCVGAVPLLYNAPTDRLPHQVSPPALGAAGTVFKDPTYGTSILRLTDANTINAATSFRVANEFWGNDWSLDSKLFYLQAPNGSSATTLLYTFDPSTMTTARVEDMTEPGTPLAMPVTNGGFSRTEPTVLYGFKGFTIERFDFSTQTMTAVVALDTIVPGVTGNVLGVQQGTNGLFVCGFGPGIQDTIPYIATYDPSTQAAHVIDIAQSTLDGRRSG